METPKPMQGVWSLVAPDGREWRESSPLRCVSLEQSGRVPANVALARILEAANPTPDEADAERYRWLRGQHWYDNTIVAVCSPKDAMKLGYEAPSGERLDELIDEAMRHNAGNKRCEASD